jgi:hypothetical protein
MRSVGGATVPVADVGVLEHQRNDAVKEFLSFLPGVLVNGVQLGHAIGRAQVFIAQHHDDQTGLAQRLHEVGNLVAVIKRSFVSDEVPML